MTQFLDKTYFFPKVLQVIPTDVYTYFNDGSVRFFDVKTLIQSDTVFAPLQDINYFKSKLAVINDTIAWDIGGNRNTQKCIDIDPFVIFEQPIVPDPFESMVSS
jgi:hypothetical protein